MSNLYFTYILASKRVGALYVGCTDDLVEQVLEHKCHRVSGLTKLYNITQLVYFEAHSDLTAAADRERDLKQSHRMCKLELIESFNPEWDDLYPLIAD